MQVFGMYSGYLSGGERGGREGRSSCALGALLLRGALFELLLSVAFSSFLAGLTDFPVDLALASAMTLLLLSLLREPCSRTYDVSGWAMEAEADRVRGEGHRETG